MRDVVEGVFVNVYSDLPQLTAEQRAEMDRIMEIVQAKRERAKSESIWLLPKVAKRRTTK